MQTDYRLLFDSLEDSTIIRRLDGSIIDVNQVALRVFGYTYQEMLQTTIEHISSKNEGYTQQMANEYLARAMKTGAVRFQWRSKKKDGSIFWSDIRCRRVDLGSGPCLLTTIRDISAEKDIAAKLDLARTQYTLLVRNLPAMAILLFDHDLRFVLADGPEIEATGFSKPLLEGRTVYEALPPDFVKQIEPHLKAALKGIRTPVELPWQDRWYQYEYAPVRNDRGEIVYGMVLAHNITARKNAEDALRKSEAKLLAITQYNPAFILELDENNKVVYVNRTNPGVEHDSILGVDIFNWTLPTSVEAFRRALNDARAGRAVSSEFQAYSGSGQVRHYAVSIAPIEVDLYEGRLGVTAIDVTEQKEALQVAEAERERLINELKLRNAEMEQFTYTVSHDLKSPLVTIRGFIGALERDISQGNIERAASDLQRISSAANKMNQLLTELLDLSRIGRVGHNPLVLSLNDVVRDAIELLSGRIAGRKATILVAPDLPDVVGDKVRLVQVFQNLIENALKYMGDQGEPLIEIGTYPHPSKSICYVRDNGIGIDSRYLERVFGLFEKLDPKTEGTGVGLALVRRVIDYHSGKVWAESMGSGLGSTIVVEMPRPQDS